MVVFISYQLNWLGNNWIRRKGLIIRPYYTMINFLIIQFTVLLLFLYSQIDALKDCGAIIMPRYWVINILVRMSWDIFQQVNVNARIWSGSVTIILMSSQILIRVIHKMIWKMLNIWFQLTYLIVNIVLYFLFKLIGHFIDHLSRILYCIENILILHSFTLLCDKFHILFDLLAQLFSFFPMFYCLLQKINQRVCVVSVAT